MVCAKAGMANNTVNTVTPIATTNDLFRMMVSLSTGKPLIFMKPVTYFRKTGEAYAILGVVVKTKVGPRHCAIN